MADFDDIRALKQSLIRKTLKGAVLIGDSDTEIPAAFTGSGSDAIVDLSDFKSVGHISKDAPPTFTPETETSDVESWGLLEASRTDMISRNTTITWTGQETHKLNLELYTNTDLSDVTADAQTGEVHVVDPTDPGIIYRRLIFLSVDGAGDDAVYIVKIAPRFVVTEVSEQSWSQEDALEYSITGRAKVDEELGYALKTVFFGPGWKKMVDAAGFSDGSGSTGGSGGSGPGGGGGGGGTTPDPDPGSGGGNPDPDPGP